MIGKGNLVSLGDRKALMAQRNPTDIRVYTTVSVPEAWAEGNEFDWSEPKSAKNQLLKQYFSDWDPLLRDLSAESDDRLRLWPLYGLPKPSDGGGWKHRAGLTLVGDAAHVMPPWTVR